MRIVRLIRLIRIMKFFTQIDAVKTGLGPQDNNRSMVKRGGPRRLSTQPSGHGSPGPLGTRRTSVQSDAAEVMEPSQVGKQLSDLTTRRVILLVL